jgi:predicted metal-dependent phosphoesterase TrpH
VHLLVYGRHDSDWSPIEDRLVDIAEERRQRIAEMARRLASKGYVIDVESIIADAGQRSLGRPDVARALVKAGIVADEQAAFSRFLFDGSPVVVPSSTLSLGDGLALAESCAAHSSLAHPHVYGLKMVREICQSFSELDAVEAYYGGYGDAARRQWLDVAAQFSLAVTGGSDAHDASQELGIELPERHADVIRTWSAA